MNFSDRDMLFTEYLSAMSDDTGILQHSIYGVPDPKKGYTADDNSRALILAVMLFERSNVREYLMLIYKYIAFLLNAQNDNGKFKNFMNYNREFLEKEGSEDCSGRCIWMMATGWKRGYIERNIFMRVLLVYPDFPDTFWGFKHALKFVSKKASFPPLGLLTVAAMLPGEWEKKLVDMNVSQLKDKDIERADYVFISAMSIQRKSVCGIIARCKKLGVKTIAGGPLFTAWFDDFDDVDHLVLNEAEMTLPLFLEDVAKGQARHIYTSTGWADIKTTPVPLWGLIDMSKYASMNIQYSRGCPFNCEFCDIIQLYGRIPRLKSKEQIIMELDAINLSGWQGSIFFVDDNFIGNKEKLKLEILPALIEWMERKSYPFTFFTEASINLSDDEELLDLMVKAGFNTIFVGIESPNEESLVECNKYQNKGRNLLDCIKKLQRSGLEVQGGFIIGFDSDPDSIFETLIKFIQESGVITAMVGLLNAPRGTKLHQRLTREGRILNGMTGDNTDFSINFIPKMNKESLIEGYKKVLSTIYTPKHYYERVMQFFWTLFKNPRLFPMAITYAIYGYHFRKILELY